MPRVRGVSACCPQPTRGSRTRWHLNQCLHHALTCFTGKLRFDILISLTNGQMISLKKKFLLPPFFVFFHFETAGKSGSNWQLCWRTAFSLLEGRFRRYIRTGVGKILGRGWVVLGDRRINFTPQFQLLCFFRCLTVENVCSHRAHLRELCWTKFILSAYIWRQMAMWCYVHCMQCKWLKSFKKNCSSVYHNTGLSVYRDIYWLYLYFSVFSICICTSQEKRAQGGWYPAHLDTGRI